MTWRTTHNHVLIRVLLLQERCEGQREKDGGLCRPAGLGNVTEDDNRHDELAPPPPLSPFPLSTFGTRAAHAQIWHPLSASLRRLNSCLPSSIILIPPPAPRVRLFASSSSPPTAASPLDLPSSVSLQHNACQSDCAPASSSAAQLPPHPRRHPRHRRQGHCQEPRARGQDWRAQAGRVHL